MDEDSPRKVHRFSGKSDEDFTLLMMRIEALLESKELFNGVLEDGIGEEKNWSPTHEIEANLSKLRM